MERKLCEPVLGTWKSNVPVNYSGEINLQAALLLLYEWDEEHQQLIDKRTSLSFNAAA